MTHIEADWLRSDATQGVFLMLEQAGHQAYAVGGCVRDSLLKVPVKDIDIATDATPDKVMSLSEASGFHAVPTGIEHGTVTVVARDVPHEVTTFRKDVETDGRRATVAFADSIHDDAKRRDFTMNALYSDRHGTVTDPVGGLEDLDDHRIRFIEDAATRIHEDYLRSLRFFRFFAWYGDPSAGFDEAAIAAIAGNLDGLPKLSRERVGSEVLRLLSAPDPAPAVAGMRSTGVLGSIFPGADDTALAPLVHLEVQASVSPDPIRRLAVLGGHDPVLNLRLSRQHAKALRDVNSAGSLNAAAAGYRFGEKIACDALLVTAASLGQAIEPAALELASSASTQRFPVRAADLMPGMQGPKLGATLKQLEEEWISSGFALDRKELLKRVPNGG